MTKLRYTSPGVGFLDTRYLKLDQSTPQTITDGIPKLDASYSDFTLAEEIVNKDYVDNVASAFGIRFYTTDSVDGGTGYYEGTLSIPGFADHTIVVSDLTNDELIATWITESGASLDKAIRGLHEGVLFCEKTSGTKDLRIYFKLYERESGGTENLIGTSMYSREIDTLDAYIASLLLGEDYDLASGSRLVLKLYAGVSGSGNAPEITIHCGTDYLSYVQAPTNLEILEDIFVNRAGDTMTGSLGIGGHLKIAELSANPSDPDEGNFVLWMSDGTELGDDGDVMWMAQAGGVVKYGTLVDFSSGVADGMPMGLLLTLTYAH